MNVLNFKLTVKVKYNHVKGLILDGVFSVKIILSYRYVVKNEIQSKPTCSMMRYDRVEIH